MLNFESIPIYWANRLSAMTRRELTNRFRAAGHNISPEEWAILLLLWRQDAQNPGEMSARTVRDPTTMTRLIDAMVRKGLVVRRADPTDRRRSSICLTEHGRTMEPVLIALAAPMITASLDGVSKDDAETTVRVLSKMIANISAAKKGER